MRRALIQFLALFVVGLMALSSLILLCLLTTPAHAWTHGTSNAAKPLGKFAFYFANYYDSSQFDAWIAHPTAGVTAISLGDFSVATNSAEIAKIHNAGLAYLYDDGADCGFNLAQCKSDATAAGVVPIDAVWFNEPDACAAGVNVSNWNAGLDAWYAAMRPGALAGISSGGAPWQNCKNVGVTQQTLGQEELFTNNEVFSGNDVSPAGLYGVELLYGTAEICVNGPSQMPDQIFQTVGFWDVDAYGPWAGSTIDDNWLANAESYASGGTAAATAMCKLPISLGTTPPSGVVTANFSVGITDYVPNGFGSNTVGTCQYQVMAGSNVANGNSQHNGATVTVPWTSRACGVSSEMTLNLTIGASGNCNVSDHGNGNFTCAVMYRAFTSGSNLVGDVGVTIVQVNF